VRGVDVDVGTMGYIFGLDVTVATPSTSLDRPLRYKCGAISRREATKEHRSGV